LTAESFFERLYEEHALGLLQFLTYRCGDRVLAEDLMTDTFERVLRARRPFDRRRASEKTWLYTIALNLLRDQARRRDVEERAMQHLRVPAAAGASLDDVFGDRDALQRALATLAEEEREAVALRYGADLTVPEMAKVLDLPLTTVEGRVYRALRKLRDELG
jgi:RNA polymerase sigma-70 factor (ECF subfamily)